MDYLKRIIMLLKFKNDKYWYGIIY